MMNPNRYLEYFFLARTPGSFFSRTDSFLKGVFSSLQVITIRFVSKTDEIPTEVVQALLSVFAVKVEQS